MNEEQIRAKILAAAYLAASELGTNKAVELLQDACRDLKRHQWSGAGNQ